MNVYPVMAQVNLFFALFRALGPGTQLLLATAVKSLNQNPLHVSFELVPPVSAAFRSVAAALPHSAIWCSRGAKTCAHRDRKAAEVRFRLSLRVLAAFARTVLAGPAFHPAEIHPLRRAKAPERRTKMCPGRAGAERRAQPSWGPSRTVVGSHSATHECIGKHQITLKKIMRENKPKYPCC